MSRSGLRQVGLLGIALSILAVTACADWLSTTANFQLPAVDAAGSPTTAYPGSGAGKLYKDEGTGITFGIFTGSVINKSGSSAVFNDQGLSFQDPWTQLHHTTTADTEYVLPPNRYQYSNAFLIILYNPADDLP